MLSKEILTVILLAKPNERQIIIHGLATAVVEKRFEQN